MILIGIILFLKVSVACSQNQSGADSAISVLKSRELKGLGLLDNIYSICARSTNPDEKIDFSNKLIEEASDQGNYKYLILGNIMLGSGHKLKGDLSKALKAYLEAAKIASANNNPVYEGDAYTNIATVYTSNEDYSRSLKFYNKALDNYRNNIDSSRLAGIYINYGYATYKASLYDSAISLLKKALYFSQFASYSGYKAYAQSNMALTLAKIGRFAEAENQLNEALKIMENNEDHYGLSDCLIEIGGVYIEKGDVSTAIDKLTHGYSMAVEYGLKQQIQNGAKYLSAAYKQKGNLEKALDYQTKYYTYRDSLINAEQIRKLADLRTNYKVGQKQVEVNLLTAQKKTQRIIIWAITGGAVLVVILLVLVYRNYRDKNRINKLLEEQKTQLEDLNHTKDKFFSIVSHDLRGPVMAFSGISRLIKYSAENKDHEGLMEISGHIDQTVDHLSGLLDNLLTWAMQQQGHFPNVPEKLGLKEIVSEIKGIFSNMAEGKNIELVTELEESMMLWGDKNSVSTILRNLVNNALKFTPEGGTVAISAKAQSEYAEITVSDTGVGMSEEKLNQLFKMEGKKTEFGTAGEKGLGLGLQLVYEFVEMNNGTIEVKSEEGKGAEFVVRLPLYESVSIKKTEFHNS